MRSNPILFLACCLVSLITACSNPNGEPAAAPVKHGDSGIVMSILYQQQAAEYRALCLQAYNLARSRVLRTRNQTTKKDSLAVITDLDETVLDNSPNEAQLFLDSNTYSGAAFSKWAQMKKAGYVPGSLAFFKFVDSLNGLTTQKKKIAIFYVSNRADSLAEVTRQNMANMHFPQTATVQNFLFQTDPKDPSKEPRRRQIEKNHEVLVLLGDNLIDLDSSFDSKYKLTEGERRTRVDDLIAYWGDRYIVLPNAIYGDWEAAMYKYAYPSLADEWTIRRDSLHGYKPRP